MIKSLLIFTGFLIISTDSIDISGIPGKGIQWSFENQTGYEKMSPNIILGNEEIYLRPVNISLGWDYTVHHDFKLNNEQFDFTGKNNIRYYERVYGGYEQTIDKQSFSSEELFIRSAESLNNQLWISGEFRNTCSFWNFGTLWLFEIDATTTVDNDFNKIINLINKNPWMRYFRPWIGLLFKYPNIDQCERCTRNCAHYENRFFLIDSFMKDYQDWYDFALIKADHACINYSGNSYVIKPWTGWAIKVENQTLSLGIQYEENYIYRKEWTASTAWTYFYEWTFLKDIHKQNLQCRCELDL